jgi:NTP pyrophosphatase (non-canonical NTP hydrolase)
MNLTKYVPLAVRTEKPLPTLDRLIHGCLGLITEIGEVTTEVKRMEIYGKPLDAERKAHIMEEIGDVMWYVAIILATLEIPLQDLRITAETKPPETYEGMFAATAIMFADRCGRICAVVQEIHMNMEHTNPKDVLHMITSLELIMVGLGIMAKACDSSLSEAMADNITKLQIRYPEKYTNELAEGRADKQGADARVS